VKTEVLKFSSDTSEWSMTLLISSYVTASLAGVKLVSDKRESPVNAVAA
jgi:hypothetical protein